MCPIFEYLCEKCKQTTEKLEPYSDISVRDCEICGSTKSAYKIISRGSFALSGSGWYTDSYQSKKS